MTVQQGDVILCQTPDDGEISVAAGSVAMSGGLETAAYLSLSGGNEDDDGSDGNPANWWGNIDETQAEREYHSETQNLLQGLPATANNLRKVEDAARRDLAWMVSVGAATEIEVAATIPAINRVKLTIDIDGDQTLEFVENWQAAL